MIGIIRTGFSECIKNSKYQAIDVESTVKRLVSSNNEILKNITNMDYLIPLYSQENTELNKISNVTNSYPVALENVLKGYVNEDQAVKSSIKY